MVQFSRRDFLMGVGVSVVPMVQGCTQWGGLTKPLSVGALFAGKIDDKGFMEAGWRGLERARVELGVQTRFTDSVIPQRDLLVAALSQLAASGVDLVVAHGGQNNEACSQVAALYPQVKFVVTQGGVTGANLSSYEVLQEESAYLGGVLAAMTTRTGVVGHMSGIRVRPGLKGRAAYVAGVKATDPKVRVLTNFSGNQDDNALSKKVALAQINAGVDVIFTMLNAGRTGVIDACRERGVRQIGNVVDWVERDPKVFVASAIADVSNAVFDAILDAKNGKFVPAQIRKVGLQNAQAVRLTVASDVPAAVRQKIAQVSADIQAGRVTVTDVYEGLEFPNPA